MDRPNIVFIYDYNTLSHINLSQGIWYEYSRRMNAPHVSNYFQRDRFMTQRWKVLYDFWFETIELTPEYYERKIRDWFWGENQSLDHICRDLFSPWLEDLNDQEQWHSSPSSLVSLILLHDQIPRNAFRGKPQAYHYDAKALDLCLKILNTQAESLLNPVEKIFLYMPLQHSENLAHQNLSVEKFRQLHLALSPDLRTWSQLGWIKALEHRDVIERFGRFPHRNSILGRKSTQDEIEFLRPGLSK